jgi:hypothetical protein
MKPRLIQLAVIAAAISLFAGQITSKSRAQDTESPPEGSRVARTFRMACGIDMEQLCPGLVKKEARHCLKAHRAQLTSGCRTFLQEARMRRKSREEISEPPGAPLSGDSWAAPPAGGPQRGGPPPSGSDDNED